MFPIFSTALAIVTCLVGIEFTRERPDLSLSPFAAFPLLIVPLGEVLVLIARRKGALLSPRFLKAGILLFSVFPVLTFAGAVFLFGAGRGIERIGLAYGIFLDKALLLGAYLALSNLTRFFRMRFTRAAGLLPPGSGRMRLKIAFKGEMTVAAPFLIFVFFSDLLHQSETASRLVHHLPVLFWTGLFTLFLALVYCMPWIVKRIWGMKPLPKDSHLRKELLWFIESQDFKVKDILVLETGGLLVNAAILGLTPRSRYILFTDAMLRRLAVPELKAVTAHELGHGVQKHMIVYLLFSTAFVFGISLLDNLIPPLAGIEEELEMLLTLLAPAVLVYWWLVFGFLSRRFETEADLFGAAALKDPQLFISTLEKVAQAGMVERKRGSWRHFSIDRRAALLEKFFYYDPSSARGFLRRMKRVRWGIVLFFLLLLAPFLGDMTVDTVAGMGLLALKDGDYQTARARLETACRLPGGASHRWSLFSAYLRSGQLEAADRLLGDLTSTMDDHSAPRDVLPLFIELALAYFEQGKGSQGLAALATALSFFPNDIELNNLKVLASLFLAGDTKPLKDWMELWKQAGDEPGIDPRPGDAPSGKSGFDP